MPTFSLTDNSGSPISVPVRWTSASALFRYLKSETMHLIVFPDFVERSRQPISSIKPQPLKAHVEVGNECDFGGSQPELSIAPKAAADLQVNTQAGADLFADDAWAVPAIIPAGRGYIGLVLAGSLDLGVSGSAGNLTFGFDHSSQVELGYWRAFPTAGADQPTLGDGFAAMISSYSIPANLADLSAMQTDDICTVSGTGSLKVSGGIVVKAIPNPLACVPLPLNVGKVVVQAGAVAGVSASFQLTGSYQIRVRRMSDEVVELSVLKEKDTTFKTAFSGSAGISVKGEDIDLVAAALGAIDPGTDKQSLLKGGLTPDQAAELGGIIKGAIDHSLRASFNAELSRTSENKTAFQYRVHVGTAGKDPVATEAINRALKGDLSKLTALEQNLGPGGTIAPGIEMLSSVFSSLTKRQVSFRMNLLGLLNVVSLSDLVASCKVVTDPVTCDVTITDSITGTQLDASLEPPKREERLRKAMFDSLMVTAIYKASGAIEAMDVNCENFHFAMNQKTNNSIMEDYCKWLEALGLSSAAEKQQWLAQFKDTGPSACLLRTSFSDRQLRALFFDEAGVLRPQTYYLDFGRRALMVLLDSNINPLDHYRYALLDKHWDAALRTGPSPALAGVLGITSSQPDYNAILSQVMGDLYDVTWWASGMVDAGLELEAMITFLAGRDPVALRNDPAFTAQREKLRKKAAQVIGRSKARFNEPWGLLSLFWAAGSEGASARLETAVFTIVKP